MIRIFLIITISLSFLQVGWGQTNTIELEANQIPLNVLLLQLRDQYDFQLSYTDNELSKYKVTVSKTFESKEEALQHLILNLPFQLKKSGEVFIIIPDKKKDEKKVINISGQIIESGTFEPLSFSNIIINKKQILSDVTGSFNFVASAGDSFHMQISHLGYYIFDTILYAGINQKFKLVPSIQKLPEVTIQNNVIERSAQIGKEPGNMKINHNISRYLPGQGDNSVFNLLRLMPGIQASNEQSTDLLIWNSYEGQSLITFDEFTLFGLKNYNNNISIVNPFIVKNIEIYKGGYQARYGNRVGALVTITGKNGSLQKPTFSFNVNATTINGMAEIPVFKKSSLLMAYRQTYYNLYNPENFNIYDPTKPARNHDQELERLTSYEPGIKVFPDNYQFRDFNIKYSTSFNNNDQFYFSMYLGGDDFKLTAERNLTPPFHTDDNLISDTPFTVSLSDQEKNSQMGMSAFFNKNWNNGNSTKIIFSHSDYMKKVKDTFKSLDLNTDTVYNKNEIEITNEAIENSIRIENIINLTDGHQLEFGGGFYSNNALVENINHYVDTISVNSRNEHKNNRGFLFLQDNLPLNNRVTLKSGIRINLIDKAKRIFIEPRLSATYSINTNLKMNFSWGIYNQFMYKIANIDKDKNYTYLWVTGDNTSPVLNATHWVWGINYFKNDFTINIESYYKTTHNLSRHVFERRFENGVVTNGYYTHRGDAKAYGIDTYIRQDFGKHSVWASYTLSKAVERLAPEGMRLPSYMPALQDQRHELKIAALFNIRRFYLSANYVYGSGMEILKQAYRYNIDGLNYKRFDVALTYKLKWKKMDSETGISVLNLFNTQNLNYNNVKSRYISDMYDPVNFYSNAVPFTPTLFLKVVF